MNNEKELNESKYGKILMHDNGVEFKEGDIVTPGMNVIYKKSYKKIIQKEIIEEIARDVLNNSNVLMSGKRPFEGPVDESNGECDNISTNYQIDTKLLWMQSVCYKISKNERQLTLDVSDYAYLYNFYSTYKSFKRGVKPKDKLEENKYEIIEMIKRLLNRNKEKNILFIFPIPQMDIFFMNDLNFSRSFLWSFFWTLGQIKRDCKFKKDIYFAYPLLTNEYNLVKIDIKSFTCEPFIKSEAQYKYLETLDFGLYLDGKLYPFWLELEKEDNYIYKFKYLK